MKLYITAPMTNVPRYNHTAIDTAEAFVKQVGHEAVSPAAHERLVIPDIAEQPGFVTGVRLDDTHRLSLLTWDLHQVLDCDGIVVLPGKGGRGMRIERDLARATGKRVYHLVTEGSGIGQPWIEGAQLRLIETPEPVIVGLSGYGRSGKSTAALTLSALGFVEISFADAIRESLYALNPSIKVKGNWTKLQTHVQRVGWEAAKRLDGVRRLMQRMGTEVGRNIMPEDTWPQIMQARVEACYNGFDVVPERARFVIPDTRTIGDAKWIRNNGGEVWRIEREGTGPINEHVNETELDGWDFDAYITNCGDDMTLYTNVIAECAAQRGVLDPAIAERLLAFFDPPPAEVVKQAFAAADAEYAMDDDDEPPSAHEQ